MPFAIMAHILFSWWIYTNQNIFPVGVVIATDGTPIPKKISTGYRLFATEQGIPFFIFFILTVLYYAYIWLIGEVNYCLSKKIRAKWEKFEQRLKVEKRLPRFTEIEDQLRHLGNHTYSPYENQEYSELLYTIKHTGDRKAKRIDMSKPTVPTGVNTQVNEAEVVEDEGQYLRQEISNYKL